MHGVGGDARADQAGQEARRIAILAERENRPKKKRVVREDTFRVQGARFGENRIGEIEAKEQLGDLRLRITALQAHMIPLLGQRLGSDPIAESDKVRKAHGSFCGGIVSGRRHGTRG